MADKIAQLFAEIDINDKDFKQKIARLHGELNKTDSKFVGLSKIAVGLGGALTTIGTALGLTGGAAIKAASEIEQYEISLSVMLGSLDKAKYLIKELTEFSNVTPFEPDELIKATETLLAFGVAGNDILPTIKQIGDISRGNAEKFNALALAFGQMSSTGRLMGQDLLQMINAGFNPLLVISEKTGKSVAQLKDEMSKGAISAEMVADAFRVATEEGGQFNGMMGKMSTSVEGLSSTLSGKLNLRLAEIGKIISPLVKLIQEHLIDAVDRLGGQLQKATPFLIAFTGELQKAWLTGELFWAAVTKDSERAAAALAKLIAVKDETSKAIADFNLSKIDTKVDLGDAKPQPVDNSKEIKEAQSEAEKIRDAKIEKLELESRQEIALKAYTEEQKLNIEIATLEKIERQYAENSNERLEIATQIQEKERQLDDLYFEDLKEQNVRKAQSELQQAQDIEQAHKEKYEKIGQYARSAFDRILDHSLSWKQKMLGIAEEVGWAITRALAAQGFSSLAGKSGALGAIGAIGKAALAFDTGGIVPGSFAQPVPITAHGSEMILNPSQQAALWNYANGGGQSRGGQQPVALVNITVNSLEPQTAAILVKQQIPMIKGEIMQAMNYESGMKAAVQGAVRT